MDRAGARRCACVLPQNYACAETEAQHQVKPKYLQNLKLDAPSANKTARVGSLERKAGSYDVWSLGDEPNEAVAADEMRTLQPLLPRKKKGTKFYAGAVHYTLWLTASV